MQSTKTHDAAARRPASLLALALVAAGAVVAACSASQAPSAAASTGPALTYYKDVKPIVDAKCIGCHVEGGLAPFALTSASGVVAEAELMKSETASRVMPPWMAGPNCQEYAGDESLSADQIKTIGDWADQGAAAGDPSDEGAPLASDTSALSRVDSTIQMPVSYTPVTHPDEYRCFLIDWPETEAKYITGFRARPGDPQIVHHVIGYIATPAQLATYEALDEGGKGWSCFGGPGGPESTSIAWVGAWAPGGAGGDFPTDTGIKILPGSKIILQVHYNTLTVTTGTDRTQLDFKLDDAVKKEAAIVPYTNPDWLSGGAMTIAAGDPDASYSWSFDISPFMSILTNGTIPDKGFLMYGAALHMHLLGTTATTSITPAAGGASPADQCLLDIPAWNFHWQRMYDFQQPILFHNGDKLNLSCHWNNSQANQQTVNGQQLAAKTVTWGEGTTDEMCLGLMYVTAP